MSVQKSNNLILKILVLGVLVTGLMYLFHPGVGEFSLMINGAPVSDSLILFAAIPTILITLLFIGILILLVFLGVGVFIFMGVLAFFMLGLIVIAPYFWPVLVVIFLVILLMSLGNRQDS